ncbi:hypothetical protein HPP92_028937 [Vanilla planifolia]|uniref:Uncharacterized protein n=1 Tax=Vanilla planifolia TaxID=51239 RepID=A0A835P5T1_VANPL|nr:hypothetical protein HPP92_028927 [Vanilla planifolia]KAG0446234.1 hypothetical protein HPP92_028937 [Vanilla planifolia]
MANLIGIPLNRRRYHADALKAITGRSGDWFASLGRFCLHEIAATVSSHLKVGAAGLSGRTGPLLLAVH